MAVMASFGATDHLFHRDYAANQFATAGVFKLNGRVADMEVIAQDVIEIGQDARTF